MVSKQTRSPKQKEPHSPPCYARVGNARLRAFKAVAGKFQEAARAGAGWDEALAAAANLVGAVSAVIVIKNKRSGAPTTFRIAGDVDPETVERQYVGRYAQLDPMCRPGRRLPLGRVVSCHHYLTNSFVARDPYYQEFIIPNGGRFSSGACIFEDAREWGGFALQTNGKQGPIEGRRLQMVERLAPHIQESVEWGRRLQEASWKAHASGVLNSLQQFGCGAVLVEGDGSLIGMNAVAEGSLGSGVTVAGSRLQAVSPAHRDAFSRLIERVARLASPLAQESLFVLPGRQGTRWIAVLSPVFELARKARGEAAVLVKLFDPDARRPAPAEAVLRDLYQLTGAEIRVAIELAGGRTLKEAAMALEIAESTARGHVKKIFSKTACRGQPELAALLERLAFSAGR